MGTVFFLNQNIKKGIFRAPHKIIAGNANVMKNQITKFIRKKEFQPIWEKLFHFSKIGMNFGGGTSHTEGPVRIGNI